MNGITLAMTLTAPEAECLFTPRIVFKQRVRTFSNVTKPLSGIVAHAAAASSMRVRTSDLYSVMLVWTEKPLLQLISLLTLLKALASSVFSLQTKS